MMRVASRCTRIALALALAAAAGLSHALTVAELQKLLQRAPPADVPYQETRESPWLSAPAVTRGVLRATPHALEKRVTAPRPETWRLLEDRIEWVGPDGAERKQVLFAQAPALKAIADVLRRAVAGDLKALEAEFKITLSGDERVWSAQLVPLRAEVTRHLSSVELQGTGARLQVVIVTERQGERTTARLLP